MQFEVITETTRTITETSIQLVEADSKEEAIQKATKLPQANVSCESKTEGLIYAVDCSHLKDLPLDTEKLKRIRRLVARMATRSKDEVKAPEPAIYDDSYSQFVDWLDNNG
ncbi:DNA recombination protein RmuC [Burkholderia cenocepacia]|uniref:hypothetical protein n=1 Tax=Burkholderia cenocepacia TaxID=95486 RepID=UPI00192AD3B9|nr:hypothetical protein [Burkholderia cenocepacia]CAD9227974.1 DNA recombination protein RmuC [Burkholderia cenocepacia]